MIYQTTIVECDICGYREETTATLTQEDILLGYNGETWTWNINKDLLRPDCSVESEV